MRAVRGVDLRIARGEFVAVMGSSGSGKSTLMNILGCLDRPTSGEYLLDGEDVSQMKKRDLSILRNAKLGFVFQSFNLLSRTSAIENVELPMFYSQPLVARAQRRQRALEALKKSVSATAADIIPASSLVASSRGSRSLGPW